MLTRPAQLSDERIIDELADGWGVTVAELEYAPLGFGSHHWRAGDEWFVTIDDLDAKRWTADETRAESLARLRDALSTARKLRDDGLRFVVAPELARDGAVVRGAGRWAFTLFRSVEGRSWPYGPFPSAGTRGQILELVVALHGHPVDAVPARTDHFELRDRDELDRALEDLDRPWHSGPHGEPARRALATRAGCVRRLLAVHDDLAADARKRPDRFVVTHGEPHAANTMLAADGWRLIDWDTALLAPPERDLWEMAGEDPTVRGTYESATGVELHDDALELYRLGWDLVEIAIYTALLRRPHQRSKDVDTSWGHLRDYLAGLPEE